MSTANVIDVHNLIQALTEAEPGWGVDDLLPWFDQRPDIIEGLREHGRPESHTRRIPWEDTLILPGLYALGRLVDLLICVHQPARDDPTLPEWAGEEPQWRGPLPNGAAWPVFAGAIGATPITEDEFHPFFHEIVAVEPADDPAQPPVLLTEHWTGQLLGTLLLVRSGVTVSVGADVMDPDVAAKSCLYWSWWRRNRPARDLSYGWGSSSQWDTDFRRDFCVDGVLRYNVDASYPRRPGKPDVSRNIADGEDRDLLRYRHGLRTDLGTTRNPYNGWLVETR